MKIKTIAGTVVVLGVLLAGLLNGLFKGFGPGGSSSGTGTGATMVNSSTEATDNAATSEPMAPAEEPAIKEETVPDESPSVAEPELPETVDVLIAGRDFSVRSIGSKSKKYTPASIADIMEMIQAAPGDSDGIRVRIVRDESALPVAEIELQRQLREAGIPDTSVLWVKELVRSNTSSRGEQ